MKVSISKEEMLGLINNVRGSVQANSAIPILGSLKMEVSKDNIKLSGTDMGMAAVNEKVVVESTTDDSVETINIEEEGIAAVPSDTLLKILNSLDSKATVKFKQDSKNPEVLKVSSGRSNFKVKTLPIEDFPKLLSLNHPVKFTLKTSQLKSLFNSVAFAMHRDETRYYLQGIFMHIVDGNLRVVASDGHRSAYSQIKAPEGSDELSSFENIIIPAKAVNEVLRVFTEDDSDLEISIDKVTVAFMSGTTKIVSRLIDGEYPDYNKVVPKETEYKLTIDSDEITKMIRRVTSISTNPVKPVEFNVSDGKLTLLTENDDSSDYTDNIESEGGNVRLSFNSLFLLDTLPRFSGKKVEMSLNGKGKPVKVTSVEDKVNDVHVMMPLAI